MGHEPDIDEERVDLDKVLADYMRRVDRGEHVDRDAFIAAHPVLAEELREYFSQVRAVDGFAAGVTADFTQQPTPHGSLEVRCPNCHQPASVAVDTQLTDLTCRACGIHFSLVDQIKSTRVAPSLKVLLELLFLSAFMPTIDRAVSDAPLPSWFAGPVRLGKCE